MKNHAESGYLYGRGNDIKKQAVFTTTCRVKNYFIRRFLSVLLSIDVGKTDVADSLLIVTAKCVRLLAVCLQLAVCARGDTIIPLLIRQMAFVVGDTVYLNGVWCNIHILFIFDCSTNGKRVVDVVVVHGHSAFSQLIAELSPFVKVIN